MDHLYKHSWNNKHEDRLDSSNEKLYTFHSDIYIEQPFFEDIKNKYKAKKWRNDVYGRKAFRGYCPTCNEDCAFFTMTKDMDTYQVICANPNCKYPNGKKSMLLHEVIKEYGGKVLFDKWRKARYIKKEAYGWKGIKSDSRKRHETLQQ